MRQSESRRKQIEYVSKLLEIVSVWVAGRSMGPEGTGFILVAFMTFLIFWSLSGEHLPDALARIIRGRRAKGQFRSLKDVRHMAAVCQIVTGIVASTLFFVVGPMIGEKLFDCNYCKLMFWLLTPVLFLRGISYLLTGYCSGQGAEIVCLIAGIGRQIIILVFGILLGNRMGEYGEKVSDLLKQDRFTAMYMGVGWCFAIVFAEIVSLLFLLLSFIRIQGKSGEEQTESMRAKNSYSGYIGAIYANMLFKSLITICNLLPVFIGMLIFFKREGEKAPEMFGQYFMYYLAICLMFIYFLDFLTIPYWTKVYGYIKRDERRLARTCFQGGMHLIFSFGLILAIGITVMAEKIFGVAVPGAEKAAITSAVKILVPGGFWLVFMSLAFYFSGMLQRLGKQGIAFGMAILYVIVFVMIYTIMWKDEKMGLLAMMYACVISSGVYAALLGAFTIQLLGVRISWLVCFVMPAIIAGLTGAVEFIAVKLVGNYLGNLPTIIGVGIAGLLIYWSALLILRNFREEELSLMPFGKILLGLGKMLSVF